MSVFFVAVWYREVLGKLDQGDIGKKKKKKKGFVDTRVCKFCVLTKLFLFFIFRQLCSKIDVLGNVLLGLGATRGVVPWPTWAMGDSVRSQVS